MTIGLGILAKNGIVLAADTEITTDDFKATDSKLVGASHVDYPLGNTPSVGVAGAGSFNYFKHVRIKIIERALKYLDGTPEGYQHVQDSIEEFMLDFYEKHVKPYLALSTDAIEVDVLVASWIKDEGNLWATERAATRRAEFGYEAIGIGGVFANELMHAYYDPNMPIDSAALLACYILMRTKAFVKYCGKESDILLLTVQQAPLHLPRDIIFDAERLFDRCADVQADVVKFSVGAWPEDIVTTPLRSIRSECDKLRQRIIETISPRVQT